jgi:beta-glucanase (GH16 family)
MKQQQGMAMAPAVGSPPTAQGKTIARGGELRAALLLALPLVTQAAKRPSPPPPAQGAFVDHLDAYDTKRWFKADGWKNGTPFDNGWMADHITFAGGFMTIRLDDVPSLGEPYTSGNYQSLGYYGSGCYEASFKAVAEPGVVTSFFTFAGPYDNGGNGKHNEIDIEFLGKNTLEVQTNFWTNDDAYASRNEQMIWLGFDASQEFHHYAFKWTSTGITWFVDRSPVRTVLDSPTKPTPKATESLHKIMMNVWPVDSSASGWAGTFVYPGAALQGVYDWVRYTAGDECQIAEPPVPPPPPPPGDPTKLHVSDLALALNARATQVIAKATIVDGNGQVVQGATVTGAWSGVITGGDTIRVTDATGAATFYSQRSSAAGSVTFCVTNVAASGYSYASGSNAETCDVIRK